MSVLELARRWATTKILLGTLLLAGTGAMAIAKYSLLPGAAHEALEMVQEYYGVDIDVDEWSFSVTDLRVAAKDVTWEVRGRYSSNELFRADEIAFDMSLLRFLAHFDLLRATHEIVIHDPKIHVEHKNSGRWNWEDALDGTRILEEINRIGAPEGRFEIATDQVPEEASADEADGYFSIDAIQLEDLHIVWVEELPGESGGGLIQRRRSELHIDDAEVVLNDIIGFIQRRHRSIRVDFDGRTADGIIQIAGHINPFSWRLPRAPTPPRDGGLPNVIPASDEATLPPVAAGRNAVWSPTLTLDVYLENVGAAALGQMTPDAAIMPTQGSMTGRIGLELASDGTFRHSTEMNLQGVTFAANEASSTYAKGTPFSASRTNRALQDYQVSRDVTSHSEGRLGDARFSPVPAIQTSVTREALSDANPAAQRTAAADQLRYEDTAISPVSEELEKVADTLDQVRDITNTLEDIRRAAPGPTPSGPAGFMRRMRLPFGR